MYTVTVYYYHKRWCDGRLINMRTLMESKNFKLKQDAKDWIVEEVHRISGNGQFEWNSGNKPSYCYCWTDTSYPYEDFRRKEYLQYVLRKGKINQ